MMDFASIYFREAQPLGHFLAPWQDHLCLHSSIILCFAALMRFMGDQPKLKNQDDAQCVYEILQVCDLENLHDEVYCQVIKQVTLNPNQESVLRGWLLLNLLTGFFLPSNILMPYATKFLQQASSDPSNIAKICQSNLRKNVMYGGRRHLPFPVEMKALLVVMGRGVGILPGCSIYLLLSSLQVAKELLQEICEQMGAGEQEEMQEFALFAIRNKIVRPIRTEEYLHDYLLEDMLVTVNLRRLTWKIPLHFEDKIYTDVHYGQIQWDYLKGKILLRYSKELEMQLGVLVMLQHWAKTEQESSAPSRYAYLREEIVNCTFKCRKTWEHLKLLTTLGWCSRLLAGSCCLNASFCFLTEHVMKLPFFGYNIFFVEKVSDSTIPWLHHSALWLCSLTQELCHTIPLKELQRMRTLRPTSEQGLPGIELNYGSAASPRTLWIELSQAKEMYHTTVVILDRTDFQH
uniref:MyTH4 domain-containing protein n=1 Tax=Pavo cristatus TaxID=9049 RepID=A0A8C9L1Z9_PAVCR